MASNDVNAFIQILPRLIHENDTVKGAIISAMAGIMTTKDDISASIAAMDKRFLTMQKRNDKRFKVFQEQLDKRFEAWQVQLDKRFEVVENLLLRIAQDQLGSFLIVSEIKKTCDQMQES